MTIGRQLYGVHATDATDSGAINVRYWIPPTPNGQLVIFCHQLGGTEAISTNYWAYPVVHATIQAGASVIASRAHGDNWGNAASLTDVVNEYNLMVAINAASSVILVGASMGGLDALLTAAKANLPAGKLKGVYLIDAVTNLKWAYTATSGGTANAFQASINTAYSLTAGTLSAATAIGVTSLPTTASYPTIGTQIVIAPGAGAEETVTTTAASTGTAVAVTATVAAHNSGDLISDFPTKTSGNDPRNNFAASAYSGLRIRFFASTADTTVAKASNTDPFQTFVAASVTESAIVTHNASTHTQVGPGKDFTDFLSRCV